MAHSTLGSDRLATVITNKIQFFSHPRDSKFLKNSNLDCPMSRNTVREPATLGICRIVSCLRNRCDRWWFLLPAFYFLFFFTTRAREISAHWKLSRFVRRVTSRTQRSSTFSTNSSFHTVFGIANLISIASVQYRGQFWLRCRRLFLFFASKFHSTSLETKIESCV